METLKIAVTQRQHCAIVTITDTGRGIEAANLAKIFDICSAVDSAEEELITLMRVGLMAMICIDWSLFTVVVFYWCRITSRWLDGSWFSEVLRWTLLFWLLW